MKNEVFHDVPIQPLVPEKRGAGIRLCCFKSWRLEFLRGNLQDLQDELSWEDPWSEKKQSISH